MNYSKVVVTLLILLVILVDTVILAIIILALLVTLILRLQTALLIVLIFSTKPSFGFPHFLELFAPVVFVLKYLVFDVSLVLVL